MDLAYVFIIVLLFFESLTLLRLCAALRGDT